VSFKPQCLATAIGSFPHTDPDAAVGFILSELRHVPVWPQLPNLGFRENMYVQYSENLPCVVFDDEHERIYFDTKGDVYSPLGTFLERVVSDDVDFFVITPSFSAGLPAFVNRMSKEKPETVRWVKGQVTGPISFGLTITDQDKRAILYHPELYEAVLKGCVMNARWQVRKLKKVHPEIILFIDEPYLSAFGSAFINIPREQVIANLAEVIEGIHCEGGLAGIHCCGNTDWSILMETPIDVINFDAYEYFQSITLYSTAIKGFFDRGGVLAWGIVPSGEAAETESCTSLRARFESGIDQLAAKGIDRDLLLERALITPSCGMGGRSPDLTEKIIRLTSELSMEIRRQTLEIGN